MFADDDPGRFESPMLFLNIMNEGTEERCPFYVLYPPLLFFTIAFQRYCFYYVTSRFLLHLFYSIVA